MPIKPICLCFLTVLLCYVYSSCRTKEPIICDHSPNHPFFFTVVNNDTQTVFTDTTDAIKMYYYKGVAKSYITDLAIFRSSSRYKFILSSATIIRTNVDSNVQRFYIERPVGIIDTLNVANSVRSSACTDSSISQSFSCTNAATYYYDDTVTGGYNVFVIKEN